MMLDRMEGNAELKSSVQLMLAARRPDPQRAAGGEKRALGRFLRPAALRQIIFTLQAERPLRPFCGANAAVLWVSPATRQRPCGDRHCA